MGGEADMVMLRDTATELAKFTSAAKQNGQEQLELSQLLKKRGNMGNTKNYYFVDKFQTSRVPNVGSAVSWLPAMQSVDCCAVPRAIRSLYSQIECEMFMGLFPEINRAWITIDNRLFLWNYYKGEDFCMYDGLDQLIVSVGLARPAAGVFPEEEGVEYVLVISTPVEIVLLKVKVKGHPVFGDIELEPTEYNLASDNVPMRSIAGTSDGRIFMAGHDGALYEFVYEQEGMLHSLGLKKKCRKVELSGMAAVRRLVPGFLRSLAHTPDPLVQVLVDHERGLLYTLSDRSALALYRLKAGAGSSAVEHVKTVEDIYKFVKASLNDPRNALSGVHDSDIKNGIRIVSLNVVRKAESELIHLVAVTHRGVRIYVTTKGNRDGSTLAVEHLRGPPSQPELRAATSAKGGVNAQLGSTSRLAQRRVHTPARLGEIENGIQPGGTTEQVVTSSTYANGITLLSFAGSSDGSAPSEDGADARRGGMGLLCAFSTDLSMRVEPTSSRLMAAFPPLAWKLEGFHEVVDLDILEQGASLRRSVLEDASPSLSAAGIRALQGLPVGRIWAMTEAAFDPTISDQEELVYSHMLYAPSPVPRTQADAAGKKTGPAASLSTAGGSGVGSKRPASEISGSNASQSTASAGQPAEIAPLTELSRQHVLPRRYFLVLTSHGLWVLVKNQPINQLHALLQGPDPGSNADIEEFFKQYGLDESCSMCLAIACKAGFSDDAGPSDAARASAEDAGVAGASSGLGGEPSGPFTDNSATNKAVQSQWVAHRAALWFRRIGYGIASLGPDAGNAQQYLPCFPDQISGNVPMLPPAAGNAPPAAIMNPSGDAGGAGFVHSGCYTGLCLHMSRLLRPVWDWTVTVGAEQTFARTSDVPLLRCRWSPEQIQMLVRPLARLKTFLRSETPFADAITEFQHAAAAAGGQAHLHNAFSSALFARNAPGGAGLGLSTPSSASLFTSSNRVGMPSRPSALSVENAKVAQLYALLDRSIQALLLFEFLQSSPSIRFAKLVSLADADVRALLYNMTWCEMVTSMDGKLVACALVKILVENSHHLAARDLVARLEALCPAFFSQGDALQISAFEEFSLAEQSGHAHERNQHLDEALERLRKGLSKSSKDLANAAVTRTTLKDACEKFERLGQPSSAVSVALYCAACYATQPLDVLPTRPANSGGNGIAQQQQQSGVGPGALALGTYHGAFQQGGTGSGALNPAVASASREASSLAMREFCYDLALEILARLLPRRDQVGDDHAVSSGAAAAEKVLRQATESQDALWHFTLYGYLLRNGWKRQLLAIESPFIVAFLGDPLANDVRRIGDQAYTGPYHADMHLLLQAEWFGKHGANVQAALVLQKLANIDTRHRDELSAGTQREANPTLEQRIRYLTKALMYANAEAGLGGEARGINLTYLKDELDVARLQSQVLDALADDTRRLEAALPEHVSDEVKEELEQRSRALETLSRTLQNPTSLYNDFAYRFGLWEACIKIIRECEHSASDELSAEIRGLYKRILQDAAAPLVNATFEALANALSVTVLDLGRKFYADGAERSKAFVFPVEFLVQGLEDLAMFHPHSNGPQPWDSWVLKTLIEVGVSFHEVFHAYSEYMRVIKCDAAPLGLSFLYESDEEFEYSDRSKFRVAKAIVELVNRWSRASRAVLCDSRVGDLLEGLSIFVGGLHSDDVSDADRAELKANLEVLIAKVRD